MKIILASKSPRRREYMAALFPDYECVSREVDESLPEDTAPVRGVELLARRKGEAVAAMYRGDPGTVIISADTLVDLDGRKLGKPMSREEAYSMLRSLSGRRHFVHTGVAVSVGGVTYSGADTTAVYFRELTDGEIWDYINSGDPMDKAGAYGIQAGARGFVRGIDGELDTVVGLSRKLTLRLLREALPGESLPEIPYTPCPFPEIKEDKTNEKE